MAVIQQGISVGNHHIIAQHDHTPKFLVCGLLASCGVISFLRLYLPDEDFRNL